MKIKKELPQFKEELTLIIVSGGQSADLYRAHKGTIKELDSFITEDPKFSDKEGFFRTSTRGNVVRSGSVLESNKQWVRKAFLKELKKKVSEAIKTHKPQQIYLFVPSHMKQQVLEQFPQTTIKKMQKTYAGNFTDHHPFELLEKIGNVENKGKYPQQK